MYAPRGNRPGRWHLAVASVVAALGVGSTGCLVASVCLSSDDCGTGQTCDPVTGQCFDGDCLRKEDCGEGFECRDGKCQATASDDVDCPSDMVAVEQAFCMDRYEASRPDATGGDAGTDETSAHSKAGVVPWYARPMNEAVFDAFQAACRAAGKHLCTSTEWSVACEASDDRTYAYGHTFDRETCNSVDTYCDDYCRDHGIGDCNTDDNCGYGYQPPPFHIEPTGNFSGCLNAYGAYDQAGNAWEVVASSRDPRGFEIRGGAYNCGQASLRHRCDFNAQWSDLVAGFRCCWVPDEQEGS